MSDLNGQGGSGVVMPEPTPFSFTLHPGSDRQTLMVKVHTVLGVLHFFLSNEEASALGRELVRVGTGLVLPEANSRFTPPKP